MNFLRIYYLPLGVALVCFLFQQIGGEWLRYSRDAILLEGQWWRLLSANFVHLGWAHWGMNMLGLGVVFSLAGDALCWRKWLIVIFLSSLAVSVGLLVFNPQMHWYVGFSGTLHGVLIAGTVAAFCAKQQTQRWLYGVVLIGTAIKLVWEQWAGAMPGSAELAGGPIVVDAHLYGALAGLLCGVLWPLSRRFRAAS